MPIRNEPSIVEAVLQLCAMVLTGCGVIFMIFGKHDQAQTALLMAIVFVLMTSY